jgi:hypothetical protein
MPAVQPSATQSLLLAKVFKMLKNQWNMALSLLLGTARLPDWVPDENHEECTMCKRDYTLIRRRHHCRLCGGVFCGSCSSARSSLEKFKLKDVRVCNNCFGILQIIGPEKQADRLKELEEEMIHAHQLAKETIERRGIEDGAIPGEKKANAKSTAKSRVKKARSSCVVCNTGPRNALLSCGHAYTCMDCAKNSPSKECPFCKKPVTKVVKIGIINRKAARRS